MPRAVIVGPARDNGTADIDDDVGAAVILSGQERVLDLREVGMPADLDDIQMGQPLGHLFVMCLAAGIDLIGLPLGARVGPDGRHVLKGHRVLRIVPDVFGDQIGLFWIPFQRSAGPRLRRRGARTHRHHFDRPA